MEYVKVYTYNGEYFYKSFERNKYDDIQDLLTSILKQDKYILRNKIIEGSEIVSITVCNKEVYDYIL